MYENELPFSFGTECLDSLWSLFLLRLSVVATCPCSSQTSEMILKIQWLVCHQVLKIHRNWLTTWGNWTNNNGRCVTCPMVWFCRSHPVYTTSRESPFSTTWPSPRVRSWTTTASNEAALFAFAKHTWWKSKERSYHLINKIAHAVCRSEW